MVSSERLTGARYSFKLIHYRFPVHSRAGTNDYEKRQN